MREASLSTAGCVRRSRQGEQHVKRQRQERKCPVLRTTNGVPQASAGIHMYKVWAMSMYVCVCVRARVGGGMHYC